MPTVNDIITELEKTAPLAYQENYDNAGLITGNKTMDVKGIMLCLDSTEDVIDEAMSTNCNMIIAHHPIVFSGLKSITGKNYVERVIIKAIKNDIALYAIHTNLDNVISGVNKKLAEKIGLINTQILAPKKDLLKKLVAFCPTEQAQKVREALFNAGAGHIGNYSHCSFNAQGTGTFQGNESTTPYVGNKGEQHFEPEVRIETIYESVNEGRIIKALLASHPYEEVAYDIYALENTFQQNGSGMIGDLSMEMTENEFLEHIKSALNAKGIRFTKPTGKKIKRVAICGGSGFFLLQNAIKENADAYLTSDVKYHQFFDADGQTLLVDAGHYETEQYTMELISELLNQKFATFAIRLTKVTTNPVNYL